MSLSTEEKWKTGRNLKKSPVGAWRYLTLRAHGTRYVPAPGRYSTLRSQVGTYSWKRDWKVPSWSVSIAQHDQGSFHPESQAKRNPQNVKNKVRPPPQPRTRQWGQVLHLELDCDDTLSPQTPTPRLLTP